MIRAFFAIPIHTAEAVKLQQDTAALRRRFESRINWIPESKWHITVKFFTAIEPEALAVLSKEAKRITANLKHFQLKIKKIASFPAPCSRNIAAHVVSNRRLRVLHVGLDKAGKKLGIRPEGRRYRPHITVAKFKSKPFVFEPRVYSHFEIPVNELVLYESKLLPDGSEYIPLRKFTIGKTNG